MDHKTFNDLLEKRITDMRETMSQKSSDYATNDDKLANFRLQGSIVGCSPLLALRGNMLKHLASVIQGMNLAEQGEIRSEAWWMEKCGDLRNYTILLEALMCEERGDLSMNLVDLPEQRTYTVDTSKEPIE